VTREERRVLLFLVFGVLLGIVVREVGPGESPVGSAVLVESEDVVVVDLYPIDLNRASPELLEELPGIGSSKATAIVAYRDANGPFVSVEQLSEVHGIGPRTVDRLRELITVSSNVSMRQRESDHIVERTPRDAPTGQSSPVEGAARPGEESAQVVGGSDRRLSREDGVDDGE
jgi:competence protein ComEA